MSKPKKRKGRVPQHRVQFEQPRIRILDLYSLVRDRVDSGVRYGLRRSVKYQEDSKRDLSDDGEVDRVTEEVANQVMGELCDLIDFSQEGGR